MVSLVKELRLPLVIKTLFWQCDGQKKYRFNSFLSVFCYVSYNLNQSFLYQLAIDCEDSFFFSSNCAYWAKDGLCTNNLEFMVKNCKKSCNLCQGEMTYFNVLFHFVKESKYNFQKICLHKLMKVSFSLAKSISTTSGPTSAPSKKIFKWNSHGHSCGIGGS